MDGKRNAVGRPPRSSRSLRPGVETLDARQLLSGVGAPGAATPALAAATHAFFWERAEIIAANAQAAAHVPAVTVQAKAHVPHAGNRTAHGAGGSGGGRVISGITYTTPGMAPEHLDLYLPGGTPPAGGWPVILALSRRRLRAEPAGSNSRAAEVAVLTKRRLRRSGRRRRLRRGHAERQPRLARESRGRPAGRALGPRARRGSPLEPG